MDDTADIQSAQDFIYQPGYQALSAQQQRLVIASYTFGSLRLRQCPPPLSQSH
ncbi:hypothetical protein [Pseudomonas syringae]|uniref:Uncharacterized protein n=1 Tax=Pseudomonas syringae CC1417 TaxID=1357272 RepID=A0AAU8LFU3_PSESX